MAVDRNRLFTVVVPLGDTLAAGAGRAKYTVQTRCRLLEAELSLGTTGTGAGNTDVDVNKGGATVLTAPGLRVASAAAAPATVRANPSVGVVGEPSGVPLEPGDAITVDIDAVPATTASARGAVTLLFAAVDV